MVLTNIFFQFRLFYSSKKKGNFYYVVKDFHTTLESILRKLLPQEVLSAFKNAVQHHHRLLLEAKFATVAVTCSLKNNSGRNKSTDFLSLPNW